MPYYYWADFLQREKLFLNDALRDCFRNAKFIGEEDDTEPLQNYSNQVMNIFVKKHLVFFTNGQRIIDVFIIKAGDVLDSVIIFF